MDELHDVFGKRVAPYHLPIGEELSFSGVADLLAERAYTYDGERAEGPVPESLSAEEATLHEKLVESIVESDDALMERYLEGGEIEQKELMAALEKGVTAGAIIPALCGSATKGVGIDLLAEFLVDEIPSPAEREPVKGTRDDAEVELPPDPGGPLAALVFKTLSDPYVGKLTFFRVYSGTFRPDQTVFNATQNQDERVGQVFTMRGKTQEPVSEVPAGDIAALAKLAHTVTGDTLCTRAASAVLPGIDFPDPLLALAIEPKTKGDEDKLSTALHKLAEEDPTFHHERNPETRQTLIKGMGEAHLDVIVQRLARHHVEVTTAPPRVAYRETVKKTASAQGRHVKQSGGRGQYAVCWLELSPLSRGGGFEFQNAIVGGAIPGQFIPSVEKGVRKTLEDGVLAGYPMVDVKAKLYDGKFHTVDSSDIAFQLAGGLAFKDAAREAGIVLLEPIMDLDVMVPDDSVGDIMGDLSSKRARIEGSEPVGRGWTHIKAKVPQGEILRYSIDLRSKTGGRATFKATFSHYEEAPSNVQERVVAEAQKAKEEAHK
jgi:elongation factor G